MTEFHNAGYEHEAEASSNKTGKEENQEEQANSHHIRYPFEI